MGRAVFDGLTPSTQGVALGFNMRHRWGQYKATHTEFYRSPEIASAERWRDQWDGAKAVSGTRSSLGHDF